MTKEKYIVRSAQAGVFYGDIVSREKDEVTMANARCLWFWSGAASLNQIANEGVKNPADCKFTMPCDNITLLGVCEIIKCKEAAVANIDGVSIWKK